MSNTIVSRPAAPASASSIASGPPGPTTAKKATTGRNVGLWKTKLCRNFARGHCSADRCRYAHGQSDLRRGPADSAQPGVATGAPARGSRAGTPPTPARCDSDKIVLRGGSDARTAASTIASPWPSEDGTEAQRAEDMLPGTDQMSPKSREREVLATAVRFLLQEGSPEVAALLRAAATTAPSAPAAAGAVYGLLSAQFQDRRVGRHSMIITSSGVSTKTSTLVWPGVEDGSWAAWEDCSWALTAEGRPRTPPGL
mmetsp:Transcript_54857/g.124871  ORF Transcript_54857/g.124871 Transcript_54857/m.124871 type:complete len:255 (+) Transcript_54857:94-858(+)|eukprot:CAMPEP_0204492268 /NCGR_PEP_ID=MMETSP0471-20130131/79270_1 /ASSEMBLY_ACC=CAM_ASM_000602 /TAXON_ID=2969 /ORGANISM="Oxyrrhis marina" /LENGTH=254 /DNA_ID=CAMNT_0051496325 /DNA_START=46 /DNA_END=810 /DNA_ORIENTATION=-